MELWNHFQGHFQGAIPREQLKKKMGLPGLRKPKANPFGLTDLTKIPMGPRGESAPPTMLIPRARGRDGRRAAVDCSSDSEETSLAAVEGAFR